MFRGRQSAGWVWALSAGIFSVGCFSNKNKDVAETGAAPPPAAYPSSSTDYSGTTGASPTGTSAPVAPVGSNPGYGATVASAAAAPVEPFSLREGEQLVPHAIVSGDSLSSIAAKYNSSIGRIQAANGMTNTKIIAGKTLQVPTSAPPSDLAMNTAAATLPPTSGTTPYPSPSFGASTPPVTGNYPPVISPSVAPTVPSLSPSPYPAGGISAAPVPNSATVVGSAPIQIPDNPASTAYPREGAIPAPPQPGGSYPVPSFEGSRIPFGQ